MVVSTKGRSRMESPMEKEKGPSLVVKLMKELGIGVSYETKTSLTLKFSVLVSC